MLLYKPWLCSSPDSSALLCECFTLELNTGTIRDGQEHCCLLHR